MQCVPTTGIILAHGWWWSCFWTTATLPQPSQRSAIRTAGTALPATISPITAQTIQPTHGGSTIALSTIRPTTLATVSAIPITSSVAVTLAIAAHRQRAIHNASVAFITANMMNSNHSTHPGSSRRTFSRGAVPRIRPRLYSMHHNSHNNLNNLNGNGNNGNGLGNGGHNNNGGINGGNNNNINGGGNNNNSYNSHSHTHSHSHSHNDNYSQRNNFDNKWYNSGGNGNSSNNNKDNDGCYSHG